MPSLRARRFAQAACSEQLFCAAPHAGCTTAEQINDPGANPNCYARFSFSPKIAQSIETSSGSALSIPQGISMSAKLVILDHWFQVCRCRCMSLSCHTACDTRTAAS
eukprot:SAG11_NODE_8021_length_1069_cov_1.010309_2_plen_107_part_00